MTLREVYQLGKKQAQSGEIGAYCTDLTCCACSSIALVGIGRP